MTYPTGAEIMAQLRYGDEFHSTTEVDVLVAEAINHLREASGTPAGQRPPETATAREFVVEYVTGHALKRVLDADVGEKLLVRADKLLARYDTTHTSTTEQANEPQVAIVSKVPW